MTANNNINSNSNNSDNIHRGAADGLETFVRENCLMLLATKAAAAAKAEAATAKQEVVSGEDDDVECKYACKTCGRTFKSFQALGGHRASHVKPKSTVDDGSVASSAESVKSKNFQCSTCGAEFGTGQALGGHMRRHRALIPAVSSTMSSVTTEEDSNGTRNIKEEVKKRKNDVVTPVLKKSSSGKRVCLELSLDYAPLVPKKEQEHVDEIEEGEIVEQEEKEDDKYDFLKLELRQPIRD